MGIEITTVDRDRVDDYNRAVWHGFHEPTVDERDLERRRERWLEGRWWAALDDGAVVATVRTLPLDTTLPGGAVLTSCGLTAVTTAPTHRRRGLMASMVRAAVGRARDQGEPLTTLIAAEWPIYGRFGYGAATEHASYRIHADARWRVEGEGTVESVDGDALLAAAPAVYDAHRLASPSEIARDAWIWRADVFGSPSEPRKGFQVVCRDDAGTATGYAMYTIDTTFDGRRPNGSVKVEELIATTPGAEARLWRHLCEIDWVRTVTVENRSVDERLPWWLADGRDVVQTARADFLWARPVDVAACLTARRYDAPVDAVIEVVDPLDGLCSGRYRLRTDGGEATCDPTTAVPHLTLPVATLGAVLFGGRSLRTFAAAGLADEHAPGALATADAAFRSGPTPWSATWF